MNKITTKQIKVFLKDVENNFTQLIDAIIFYENNDQDDFAIDIIGYIENISTFKELNLLIKDFHNRKDTDFKVYGYQKLWLALINIQEQKSLELLKKEISHNNRLKDFLANTIIDYDDGNETKNNVLKLLENNLTISKKM